MQKKDFENVLCANINRKIGLYLPNSQFVEGVLLDVKRDHITLEVNQNIVYFAIYQIQALSKNAKDQRIVTNASNHLTRNNLTDILITLRYHWVTLNNYSNHVLEGVLSSIFEDHIILINNKELLFIPKSHIADISSKVSKNDLSFLNKKEQINIQNLYKSSIGKGQTEEKKSYLKTEVDRVKMDIGIKVDTAEPITNYTTEQTDLIPILENQLEIEKRAIIEKGDSVREQEVVTIDLLNPEIEAEPTTHDTSEKTVVTPILEDLLEKETIDLLEVEEGSSVSKHEIVPLDLLNQEDVATPISNNPSEQSEVTPILGDQLEEEVEDGYLKIEQEALTIRTPQQADVADPIANDSTEQNPITLVEKDESSPIKIHFQENKEDDNVYLDAQSNYSKERGKLKKKSVLLTAWSAMNSDQSTVSLPKKYKQKSELPPDEVKTVTKEQQVESNQSMSSTNHKIEEQKSGNEMQILVEESKTSEKKNPQIQVNAISPAEVNKMLEKQYFALMNYAAAQISNSIHFEQKAKKSFFRPGFEGIGQKRKSLRKIEPSEKSSDYLLSASKEETVTFEKQYISLMRHATKMYRALREH